MSAKDVYHNIVKAALQKDGWTITHDPLILEFSLGRQLRIDLGAEQIIAAQKGKIRIAVEVKSFRVFRCQCAFLVKNNAFASL